MCIDNLVLLASNGIWEVDDHLVLVSIQVHINSQEQVGLLFGL